MTQGDWKTFLASLAPDGAEHRDAAGKSEAQLAARAKGEMEKVTAFKIIEKNTISDSEAILTVFASGIDDMAKFRLRRVGNEWKLDGPVKDHKETRTP